MVAINRLSVITQIKPDDLFVVWDYAASRTRSITGQTLLDYITNKNIKSIYINDDNHLIVVLNDDSVVDAGQLPQAAVGAIYVNDEQTEKIITDETIKVIYTPEGKISQFSSPTDLKPKLIDIDVYGDFNASEWGVLDDGWYILSGLGGKYINGPYTLNASSTYYAVLYLSNDENFYTQTLTMLTDSDWDNQGRDSIRAGVTKTAAESVGWKSNKFLSDPSGDDPSQGFALVKDAEIGVTMQDGTECIGMLLTPADNLIIGQRDQFDVVINGKTGLYVDLFEEGVKKVLLEDSNIMKIEGNLSNEILIGSELQSFFDEESGKTTIFAEVQPMFIYVGSLKCQNLIPGDGLSTTYNEGTETVTMNVDGPVDPNPIFTTVTAEIFESETYAVMKGKDGFVIQDDDGDVGFWDRNQGLRLQGQGTVTSRITSVENIELIADSFVVNKHNGQELFGSETITELVNETPYRAIDDIVGGLTVLIQNEDTQSKAVNKLCSTLYSLDRASSGKISISQASNQLGYLPPEESEGYGALYFDYVKGSVNMTLLKWEDESGAIHEGVVSESSWHGWSKPLNSIVSTSQFNSKSGYNKSSIGGGSTHNIEFWENGTIFKLSNSTINVKLLEGMHDVDGQRHGYVKYINNKGDDVAFNWYNRTGNKITNATVPNICPPDTVVEIYANYATDDYFINVSQSKVISGLNEEDQLLEGLASGFLYVKNLEVG